MGYKEITGFMKLFMNLIASFLFIESKIFYCFSRKFFIFIDAFPGIVPIVANFGS